MAVHCLDLRHGGVPRKGGRHTVRCLDNNGVGGDGAFIRCNPEARLPAEHAAVAPCRRDVALHDPCCGQLSAGAEVHLGIKGRHKFIDFDHVPSALRVPSGRGGRSQTPRRSSAPTPDPAADKAWNSRAIPDAALRARLGGTIKVIYFRSPGPTGLLFRAVAMNRILIVITIMASNNLKNDIRQGKATLFRPRPI